MQSRNPVFADLADLMTDAFSAAQAAGSEARAVFKAQAERMASELDLVSREEFDALKAQAETRHPGVDRRGGKAGLVEARQARGHVQRARLDALEKAKPKSGASRKRSTTKKSSS